MATKTEPFLFADALAPDAGPPPVATPPRAARSAAKSAPARIGRLYGAVNIGSFRISAMIAGRGEDGALVVLGSGHRAAQGIRRGYVTDMAAATFAIRDAIERAEKMAGASVAAVVVGCCGAGLASQIAEVEVDIGGRRIEEDDIGHLLAAARDVIHPDGRMVLHAQPAHYTLDGAHGVANPRGLHAERLGVDIHVMLADGAPVRNLTEAVQNAHLGVEAVIAAPIAAGAACLSPEERELGIALVEFGAEVTNVSVHRGGMLLGMVHIACGSGDITDAIAGGFGIRRFQAERLKCVHGSAIASPADHRETVPLNPGGEDATAREVPRAELIAIVTTQLGRVMDEVAKSLKALGFGVGAGGQVVFTGGGAELAGFADFAQGALGRPVRIGRAGGLAGLPEAHATPGFATLAGLVLHAAAEPIDIRRLRAPAGDNRRGGLLRRLVAAARDYF